MKSFLPLLSVALLTASCTTAYKTGQTPDDVYFSPERPQAEYVRTEKREDRQYRDRDEDRYSNDYYSYDDSYLRMKVRSRQRWSYLENDYYAYNPYAYRYYNNYYYNSPWNSYSYWNQYYNPYAPQVIVINPKSPVYNRPRTMNLHVFDNPQVTNNSNPKAPNYRPRSYDEGGNSNRNSTPRRNFGDDIRSTFGNNNSNNNNSSSSSPSRSSSSNSGSSSSGSSGSSGGGSAPVRRF